MEGKRDWQKYDECEDLPREAVRHEKDVTFGHICISYALV